ncbi:3-keto sterol reductase [Coprinopsis sp. MPI-PUGE-AT-0042]|nr:3-keto sterol reductase [Coprinopsis sp. MPI-PUGE-AT-0042]
MSEGYKPIIIVTGANGGVGYGICQRLLVQLSEDSPLDGQPQAFSDFPRQDGDPVPKTSVKPALTLIMACRSLKRAEKAKAELLTFFDRHVRQVRSKPGYTGRAEELQKNLRIDVLYLDLASLKTVFEFAKGVREKYPYVSHLACNAGLASFIGLDWIPLFKQILSSPMEAVTAPSYYLQHTGELSIDGLGWVWQCNVFGHFTLFRELESQLSTAPDGGRVVWCSSLEASPDFYDSQDWQLRSTEHSYESSKYQIDLIATTLDRKALSRWKGEGELPVRHFIAHPGVTSTNVSAALVGPFLDFWKKVVFYVARFFGSPHHPIDPFKAAIATVHLALVPLAYLSIFSGPNVPPVRFGAETDRWGKERVGLTPVKAWLANQDEGQALVDKCDQLVDKLRREESRPLEFETASERM